MRIVLTLHEPPRSMRITHCREYGVSPGNVAVDSSIGSLMSQMRRLTVLPSSVSLSSGPPFLLREALVLAALEDRAHSLHARAHLVLGVVEVRRHAQPRLRPEVDDALAREQRLTDLVGGRDVERNGAAAYPPVQRRPHAEPSALRLLDQQRGETLALLPDRGQPRGGDRRDAFLAREQRRHVRRAGEEAPGVVAVVLALRRERERLLVRGPARERRPQRLARLG